MFVFKVDIEVKVNIFLGNSSRLDSEYVGVSL